MAGHLDGAAKRPLVIFPWDNRRICKKHSSCTAVSLVSPVFITQAQTSLREFFSLLDFVDMQKHKLVMMSDWGLPRILMGFPVLYWSQAINCSQRDGWSLKQRCSPRTSKTRVESRVSTFWQNKVNLVNKQNKYYQIYEDKVLYSA